MTTIEYLQAHRNDVLQVAKRHGVTSVRVFGSVAQGEDRPNSDIDLLVTTGSAVSSWFPAGLILDLEELLGRRIDVVTEAGLNPLLRERVLAQAVAL
ncbi:MAG: nucleotidyltransferase family protein [Candidatus Krumholzibacteriia bacterium]